MSDESKTEVMVPPIDPNTLLELGAEGLKTVSEQQERNQAVSMRQLDIQEKQFEGNKMAFKYRFWFTVSLIAAFLLFAAGLIFIKDDTTTGMAILTYLGVAIFSFIGGIGYSKTG